MAQFATGLTREWAINSSFKYLNGTSIIESGHITVLAFAMLLWALLLMASEPGTEMRRLAETAVASDIADENAGAVEQQTGFFQAAVLDAL